MKKYIIISTILLSNLAIFAQVLKPIIITDKKQYLIGDHILLNVKISSPNNYIINWPLYKDSLSNGTEIIDISKTDTLFSENKKELTLSRTYTLIEFDSGSYTVEPFEFQYFIKGDTNKLIALSNSLNYTVSSIAVDTTKAIMDIKGHMNAPYTFKEIMKFVLPIILAILLVFIGIYLYKRYKKKQPLLSLFKEPEVPSHIEALKKLEELRQKKLWQNSFIKEYYSELSEIFRIYLYKRFSINALEMTSDEILESLNNDVLIEFINEIKPMLFASDMVKFAKGNPLPDENEKSFTIIKNFVEKTIPTIKTNNVSENNTNHQNN